MSNKDKEGSASHDEKREHDVPDEAYTEQTLGEAGVWTATLADAQAANAHEHSFTVREALRAYPWAVFWSFAVSMSIIMEGYDTILVGSLYAYPTFAEQFGTFSEATNNYQIPTQWQSAMGSGPQAGAVIGAIANGFFIARFGYKPAFMIGVFLMTAFIFISFFGMTIELQAAAQILCGVPWGIFATIGSAYASELCPHILRPYLTSYVNLCFAAGQFIGAGVLQSLLTRNDQWAWRIPFALQWMWPPFLLIAAIFMPESPWHLVRKGKYIEAEKSLLRLMADHEKPHSRSVVAMMIHTNNIERELTEGTSYLDCFRGDNLRRTEIACLSFLGQITCGIQFAFSATYFFQQAGVSPSASYKLNLGGTAITFLGTILSWFLMRNFGRRTLYLSGFALMTLWLFLIGCLDLSHHPSVKWGQAALCLIWLATFSLTVGPLGWAIGPEVSSTRLRSKTIVLARNSYYLGQTVSTVIEPYMVNPTAWNWRGKTGFFWCGTALITVVWAYFRLPETKGRTYEELDLMFAAKTPTLKFKNYRVDAYSEDAGNNVKEI